MKFGVDVRRVRYQDLESFGGADDFGSFTFDQGIFTGNAFANFLLGLPTKTYVAQSGPDVHAHTTQTGIYAQDEFRLSDRLTLPTAFAGRRFPHSSATSHNLTAFDVRNGGIIIPVGNTPRPGFLATINCCNPSDPNNSTILAARRRPPISHSAARRSWRCPQHALRSHRICEQSRAWSGLRQFYWQKLSTPSGLRLSSVRHSQNRLRGGFGIFTMTNLGQLSFNTTNIDVVRRPHHREFLTGGILPISSPACAREEFRPPSQAPGISTKHPHQLPRPPIRAVESDF